MTTPVFTVSDVEQRFTETPFQNLLSVYHTHSDIILFVSRYLDDISPAAFFKPLTTISSPFQVPINPTPVVLQRLAESDTYSIVAFFRFLIELKETLSECISTQFDSDRRFIEQFCELHPTYPDLQTTLETMYRELRKQDTTTKSTQAFGVLYFSSSKEHLLFSKYFLVQSILLSDLYESLDWGSVDISESDVIEFTAKTPTGDVVSAVCKVVDSITMTDDMHPYISWTEYQIKLLSFDTAVKQMPTVWDVVHNEQQLTPIHSSHISVLS